MRRSLPVLFFWAALGRLLWAQTYDSTVVTVRAGCYPEVVFPGETFAFRFDYRASSAVDTVYIPQDFDWSPLEVVGYRYIEMVEDGSKSLQVILRVPDTPDNWSRDMVIGKQPPVRWRLKSGEEREEEQFCSTLVHTRYIYYTSPEGGLVYEDRSAGSWHLINRGVRDNTVLPIARGSGYLIFGLEPGLVRFSLWPWRDGIFKVWVEGPLYLYHINPSMDTKDFSLVTWQVSYFKDSEYFRIDPVDTFTTNSVPYHTGDYERYLDNAWRLLVIPRPEAPNESRGKIVAAFYREGVELFRRELNFYVYGDFLKNNVFLTSIFKDTSGSFYTWGDDWSNRPTVQEICSGYTIVSNICPSPSIAGPDTAVYSFLYSNTGSLSIISNYAHDDFVNLSVSSSFSYIRKLIWEYKGKTKNKRPDINEILEELEEKLKEEEENEREDNTKIFYTSVIGDATDETENYYAVFNQNARVVFELGERYNSNFLSDTLHPIYALRNSYFLGQFNYTKKIIGYPGFVIQCTIKPSDCNVIGTYGLEPVILNGTYKSENNPSGSLAVDGYDDRDIVFFHNYFNELFYSPHVITTIFNFPSKSSQLSPEDTTSPPLIDIRLLANPSVQRLQDLAGSLNDRRPFEFIVQVYQNGQPLANTPLTVEGPFADDEIPSTDALLLLNEPQQTNAFGIYSFFWIPPSKNWFEGKSMPYGFRFRVRVGDTWEDATVQVSNLIIQGQLVQRHAGAKLRQDPDRDGLLPLANVEVSLEPDFPPDRTVRTDANGHFELGVPETGSYQVYARRREFWPDNFPKWSRTQGRVFVTESGPVPDTLLLFLAELPVGPMLQRWIPEITFDMESVRDSLQHLLPHTICFREHTTWQIVAKQPSGKARWGSSLKWLN